MTFMGVIKLLFGWKALSIGGDSSLILETWPGVCVSFCSQFSSEELFFAMNGGECRDPELFKVLTVSDCGMLDPTQVTCITPSKAREHPGRGGRKTLSLRGRGGMRQNRALVTAWASHSGAHGSCAYLPKTCTGLGRAPFCHTPKRSQCGPIPHRGTMVS